MRQDRGFTTEHRVGIHQLHLQTMSEPGRRRAAVSVRGVSGMRALPSPHPGVPADVGLRDEFFSSVLKDVPAGDEESAEALSVITIGQDIVYM